MTTALPRLDSPPSKAIALPLEKMYKLIDIGEKYKTGDYIRTNWLGAYYELGKSKKPTRHTGDDIVIANQYAAIKGKPLYAIADGVINYSHDVGAIAWGWLVTLDFSLMLDITVTELDRKALSKTVRTTIPAGYPLTARYAHMDTVIVEHGQMVTAGQQIGTVGDAHQLFAAHLHLDLCYTDLLDVWPREWPGMDLTTIALNYFAPGEFFRDYAGWRTKPMAITKRVVNAGIPAHKSFYLSSPVMRVFTDGEMIEVDDASSTLDPETGITMVQCPVDNWIPAALVGLPEITPPPPPPPPVTFVRYVDTSPAVNGVFDPLLLRNAGVKTATVIGKIPHGTLVNVVVPPNANGYDQIPSVIINGKTLSGWASDTYLKATAPK